jgi:lipopolysaccharide transport system ATP-binding protein
MPPVIKIDKLSKLYRIGAQQRRRDFRETVMDAAAAPWRRIRSELARLRASKNSNTGVDPEDTFWAIKDICLEIEAGDVVGIVGRNGSGKSTLLKILSRVTPPTTGRAEIRGRLGSLLEVGTGFHPELTGRENIYLNGAILGMKRREIARKFDEIVAFSGVDTFLDTPTKHYSSGMYVRLAFSVAAHLETEILIVDEVIAVGDIEFQRKCLGKLGDLNRSGRTVLFVSHNMAIVQNLCSRAVLLSHGQVVDQGTSASVVAAYLAATRPGADGRLDLSAYRERGKLDVIQHITTRSDDGTPTQDFISGSGFTIEIDYDSPVPLRSPNITMVFEAMTGERLFAIQTRSHHGPIATLPQSGSIACRLPDLPLAPGNYYITFMFDSQSHQIDFLERAIVFAVAPSDYFGTRHIPPEHQGRVLVAAEWLLPDRGTLRPGFAECAR